MKAAVLFTLLAVVLATSATEIDWSKIKSKNIYAEPINPLPPTTKIIGGSEVVPHSAPYQVGLIIDGSGFCGGSLISATTVLTAAHCTVGASSIQVILGAHAVQSSSEDHLTVTSRNIVTHSGYNSNTFANDIALVKLPSPVQLSTKIATIPLATSGTFDGQSAKLTGWGKTSNSGSIAANLRGVTLPVITNSACANVFGNIVISTNVCTSGSGTKGACNGDSGGPLVVNGQQIGVVSFGASDCTGGYPSAFTRVTSFTQWINSNK